MMIVGSYPMPYMDHYDHDHPLLKADFGAPVGAAVVNGSVFTRQYTKVHVSLDCASWVSKFEFA